MLSINYYTYFNETNSKIDQSLKQTKVKHLKNVPILSVHAVVTNTTTVHYRPL